MKIGPTITAHWPPLSTGVAAMNTPHHNSICKEKVCMRSMTNIATSPSGQSPRRDHDYPS